MVTTVTRQNAAEKTSIRLKLQNEFFDKANHPVDTRP